ncbi:MAG TPA: TonB-dependent receptor [Gemmatimonadaceae bacterium]|nr:TonB-dependent receptor [Gemmatimonadaceae bacterium]
MTRLDNAAPAVAHTLVALALVLVPSTLAAQIRSDSTRTDSTRATALDAVVVSATRTEQSLKSLPTHVVVLDATRIAESPAQGVPELLRSVPGFTTRDFQSTFVASPSQSIISFRGLGGSSAGRALVLLDGIPAGDPFSSWVDWGRIPMLLLQSAEVVRGGASTVWGSRSLGGVVNLRTIDPQRDAAQLLIEGGSLGTYHGTGVATIKRGAVTATAAGDFWNTDGFVVLRKDQAGPVDRPARMTNRALSGKVTYDATSALQLWAAGSAYSGGERPIRDEDYQTSSEGRGGMRWLVPNGGVLTGALFANRRAALGKSYTLDAARTTQTYQKLSDSPAHSTGMSLQYTQMLLERHELSTGVDVSSAAGAFSEKFTFVGDRPTRDRIARGTQRIGGVFVQDAADLGGGVRMVASVRGDRVAIVNGGRELRDIDADSVLSDSTFNDRTTTQLTWSLGTRWQMTEWLGWRVSAYDAFRTPSLYELFYQRFSSRGTVTEGNAELDAERMRGIEGGIDLTPSASLLGRVTVFRNRVTSPIMDITIGTAGTTAQVIAPCGLMPARQTCGQRRNVPGLMSKGVESEVEWRTAGLWTFGAGHAFLPTRVIAPGQPADGKRAIRAAKHTVNLRAAFDSPRWFGAAVEARHVGARYDDDLNEVQLDAFWLLGLRVNRAIGRGLTAHVKVENLLDEDFEIARTRAGLADMGAPRWITAGIRAAW